MPTFARPSVQRIIFDPALAFYASPRQTASAGPKAVFPFSDKPSNFLISFSYESETGAYIWESNNFIPAWKHSSNEFNLSPAIVTSG